MKGESGAMGRCAMPGQGIKLSRADQRRNARLVQSVGWVLATLCLVVDAGDAVAEEVQLPVATPAELSRLTIEELAEIEISSVSKRPEPLADAPAAIFVITREDIRRS